MTISQKYPSRLFLYTLLAICMFSMAMSGPLIRLTQLSPFVVIFWRLALAWPFLAAMTFSRREPWPIRHAWLPGLFLAAHWITWVVAIQYTSIANATLLLCLSSLWIALLSRRVLNEPVTKRLWLGTITGLFGAIIVIFAPHDPTSSHNYFGDLFAIISSFGWVAYTFIGRKVRKQTGFWGYTSTLYLVATIAVTVGMFVWPGASSEFTAMNHKTWIVLTLLAIFPTLLGHGSVNYLLRYLTPATINLWVLSEPAMAMFVAWPLNGEPPTTYTILGGFISVAGIAIGITESSREKTF